MRFDAEPPTDDEVRGVASSLRLDLRPSEGRAVAARVSEWLEAVEALDELDHEVERPTAKHPMRTLAKRPTLDNDPHNAFIHLCRVEGDPDGPLADVAVGVKDNIAVAGVPMTMGWRPMEGYTPDYDATVVTRLLDAGATIVGTLNLDPLGMIGASFGGVSDYGRVLNPHDRDRLSAGSSSGAAAAVAAGQVDVAIGGDTGGSIRMPAAWCGVVGLKPTFGLVPSSGAVGAEASGVDHLGPLARSVSLAARALETVAGRDGCDPRQALVPADPGSYTASLEAGIEGVRLGVLEEGFTGGEADPVVHETIQSLADAGAVAEPVSLPHHTATASAYIAVLTEGIRRSFEANLGEAAPDGYYPSELIACFARLRESHAREFPPFLKALLVTAAIVDARYHGTAYTRGLNLKSRFREMYDTALESADVLVMPTMAGVAPEYRPPSNYEQAIEQTLLVNSGADVLDAIGPNTNPFNLTGHPAISVPCGVVNGLPIGIQLVGRFFDEGRMLQVAQAVEELTGRAIEAGG